MVVAAKHTGCVYDHQREVTKREGDGTNADSSPAISEVISLNRKT